MTSIIRSEDNFDSATTGAPPTVQVFTVSGTWTKPAGCRAVKVTVTGGGANCVNTSTGGSAGGTAIKYIDVTGVSSVAVTVGASQQTSSFGSYCSATGGVNHNSPGTGTGGDMNIMGGCGGVYSYHSPAGVTLPDSGGPSYWGGGGAGWGGNGTAWGSGAGAFQSDSGTSYGAQGVVVVEEFY